jgi:hypothetical protein
MRRVVYGALGGVIGAACMTAVRFEARRRGWIDKTVSQTAEEWLTTHTGLKEPREPALHHAMDQALHLGYGAALGTGYAVSLGRHRGTGRGLGFGLLTWLVGSCVLLPALRAKPAPWRQGLLANAVDLCAHGLFGAVTALVSQELQQQTDHLPSSDLRRYLSPTG